MCVCVFSAVVGPCLFHVPCPFLFLWAVCGPPVVQVLEIIPQALNVQVSHFLEIVVTRFRRLLKSKQNTEDIFHLHDNSFDVSRPWRVSKPTHRLCVHVFSAAWYLVLFASSTWSAVLVRALCLGANSAGALSWPGQLKPCR